MRERLLFVLSVITHPAWVEAFWISYWSRGQWEWIVSSFGLLVGVGGFLHLWVTQGRRDVVLLLGSERRFLLLWNLLGLVILWGANTDPLLYVWLSFFLWMGLCAFLLEWFWSYSLHVYGWAGLAGFYAGYAVDYPWHVAFFLLMSIGVALLRLVQRAHLQSELWRGGVAGLLCGLGYVGFHRLMG
ncbi:MAG: hypothetical protein RMK19_04895 [Bacteroidia bacterium]|nr:hypothetical protein [Bacteroidia bacterium]MDW8015329.1 hypothetical protein [Bacteroidia bacterium]